MPEYNSEFFNPPAPVAFVYLRNPEKNIEIANVPMLIDTARTRHYFRWLLSKGWKLLLRQRTLTNLRDLIKLRATVRQSVCR